MGGEGEGMETRCQPPTSAKELNGLKRSMLEAYSVRKSIETSGAQYPFPGYRPADESDADVISQVWKCFSSGLKGQNFQRYLMRTNVYWDC